MDRHSCFVFVTFHFKADPERCTAVGDGVEVAETGKMNSFVVRVAYQSGRRCSTPQDVTADLSTEPKSRVSVVNRSPAVYEVSYQPNTRGRHTLRVQVNGTSIQGSPFQVYVRQSPHRLVEPVRVVERREKPLCIAVRQKMVISEQNRVSVWEGQQIKAIETIQSCEKTHQLNPTGVAIDGGGNIYIADCILHKVFKLNSNLDVVKSVGGGGKEKGQFDSPEGIALSEDDSKLFVCDTKNHRIQVLDTELTVVGSFGRRGNNEGEFRSPRDVACDSVGNVYVTDYLSNRLLVFSQSGESLRTIGQSSSGPYATLSGPIGVHVDHNWVYVTEVVKRCVSVFTLSGQPIASFGRNLGSPQGITIDDDGVVYVCDKNGCICMF